MKEQLEEILEDIENLKLKIQECMGEGSEDEEEEDDPMHMDKRDTQDPDAHPLSKTEYTTGEAERESDKSKGRRLNLMVAFMKGKKK